MTMRSVPQNVVDAVARVMNEMEPIAASSLEMGMDQAAPGAIPMPPDGTGAEYEDECSYDEEDLGIAKKFIEYVGGVDRARDLIDKVGECEECLDLVDDDDETITQISATIPVMPDLPRNM